ncbi:MAG: response regulator [Elusimicrobiales bacterium]|nr:response regulator [Elusimicrobiales bacterium]
MPKILVVDDIPAIVDFSKEFFEDAGFEVRTADTAPGAIAAQHEFRADVILQDLNIPGGGGLHVYETLRAENDLSPIIFSTGKPETLGDLTKMVNVSALRKPTNPDVLMAEVQKQLAARPAAAPAAPPPPAERPMNPIPPPPPKFPR